MKFSIKDFSSKCDQIRSFLRVWSHLLEKSLMQNFIFCAVLFALDLSSFLIEKTINRVIFSSSDSYISQCVFKVCGYRNNHFFMVVGIFIWFALYMLQFPIKIIIPSQMD